MNSIFSIKNITVNFAMLNGAVAKVVKILAFLIIYSYVAGYIIGIITIMVKGASLELLTYLTWGSLLLNLVIFSFLFMSIFIIYMKKEEFESRLGSLKPEYIDFLLSHPQSIDVCKSCYEKCNNKTLADYRSDLFMLNVLVEKKIVKKVFSDGENFSFEVSPYAFKVLRMSECKLLSA